MYCNERVVYVTALFLYFFLDERVNMTWQNQLKTQWDENPIQVLIVGSLAVTAVAKLLDAVSAAQGRRAYARQIDYKVRNRR